MFADLGSFFPLASKMTHDELGSIMQGFYGLCASEVKKQKGEAISFVGDTFLAFFRPGGCGGMDPEWCATRTAFHLVKGIKKISNDLDINLGIHSGEIIEGKWDLDGRPFWTILGDVVNRAAILAGGKIKGINVTRPVLQILGPRVTHEKNAARFPGSSEDESIFRLTSLVL